MPADNVLLTNGLDEGILAAVGAPRCRDRTLRRPPEAIVVVPAFDMYASARPPLGGRVVEVPLGDRLRVSDSTAILAPQSRRRRGSLFLTNPHNPTGLLIPRTTFVAIARDSAAGDRVRRRGLRRLLRDESLHRRRASIAAVPNLVVGRTFSKAYGLAGLRAGA